MNQYDTLKKYDDAQGNMITALNESVTALINLLTAQSKRIDVLAANAEASTGVTDALGNMIESLQALVNALRTANDLQISSICERLEHIEGDARLPAGPQ